MIVAGIHGGYEWNTIALADELMAYFQQYPQKIPSGVTLYILRSLNPDGRARSQGAAGRANENGVDINRNFPAFWQADWPREGCWSYMPISAGRTPASEPETKALMNFLRAHSIEALISYHSAGLGIFPGGKEPDPASIHLAEAVASVSAYPYPPINTGCMYNGQLTDWVSLEGIPAVDIELTNHQDTDFEQNLEILSVFLNWEGFNQGG
ncbi:MAG: Protein MpaA [Chloroflexi bacterium]|nr:Protein MpaA [Chloroflexota bacterium]